MGSEGLLGEVSQRFDPRQPILYGGLLMTLCIGHIRGLADAHPGPVEEAAVHFAQNGPMWSFYLFAVSLVVVGAGLATLLLTERDSA